MVWVPLTVITFTETRLLKKHSLLIELPNLIIYYRYGKSGAVNQGFTGDYPDIHDTEEVTEL